MAGLATILTTYRTALEASPASLMSLKTNQDVNDLARSTLHKTYVLAIESLRPLLGESSIHGGGQLDHEAILRLDIHFDPDLDVEAVNEGSIAGTLESALLTMIKAGTRGSSAALIVLPSSPFLVEELDPDHFRARGTFLVRYRLTADTT